MNMLTKTEQQGPYDLVLSLLTAVSPSDAEWADYENELRRLLRLHRGDTNHVLNLIISDGGAPNTQQRSSFQNGVFGGRPAKVALLTNSLTNPVKRGVARVLTWLNTGFKVFNPTDLEGALYYLQVPELLKPVWANLCEMQARLPRIETLASIALESGHEVPASLPRAAGE